MLIADTARRLSKYCRAARNPCCFPGDQWSRVTFSCEFKFLVWGKTQGFCGKPVWIKLCSFSLFSVSYPFMLHVCCDWSLKWNDQALEKGVLHQHWVESKTPVPSPQGKLFPVGKARGKEGALWVGRQGAVIPHVGPVMTITCCASTALLSSHCLLNGQLWYKPHSKVTAAGTCQFFNIHNHLQYLWVCEGVGWKPFFVVHLH